MTKVKNRNRNIFIFVAILLTLMVFGVVVINNYNNSYLSTANKNPEEFSSKYLKFTVNLPPGFQAIDESSRIIINSDEGQIIIGRNGTEFDSLKRYLQDFDQQTELNVISELDYSINGSEAVSRIFEKTDVSGGEEKIFFIFTNNSVYKLSTTEPELYDELDQIAQSFKYTGN